MWIDDLLTLQSYFEYLIQPIIRLPKRLPFLPQIVLRETHATGRASADGVSVLYLWFFEGGKTGVRTGRGTSSRGSG